MNPLIVWGDQLKVGHATIDRQHQELIRIANKLHMAMKDAKGRTVLNHLFIDLANYTGWHFATEERLMREHGSPNAQKHEQEHAELKATVTEMAVRAKNADLEITLETMNFLRDWLSHHIQHTDKELAAFIRSGGAGPDRRR